MNDETGNGARTRERAYEVGKGKPPKAYRFEKGRSGNPRGRPKNCRSTQEEVKHHLNGSMTVRAAGGSKKMNRRKILVHSLYERAVKGDNRAADILLRYDLAQLTPDSGGGPQIGFAEGPDDDALILDIARRIKLKEDEQ